MIRTLLYNSRFVRDATKTAIEPSKRQSVYYFYFLIIVSGNRAGYCHAGIKSVLRGDGMRSSTNGIYDLAKNSLNRVAELEAFRILLRIIVRFRPFICVPSGSFPPSRGLASLLRRFPTPRSTFRQRDFLRIPPPTSLPEPYDGRWTSRGRPKTRFGRCK